MKRALIAAALLAPIAVFASGAAAPTGNAEAGAGKAAACAACHGLGGNGAANTEWPKLAGQGADYTATQLAHFKAQSRRNPVMLGQASVLSAQDMADIGAYFASLSPVPGVATEASIKTAEPLYRFGDAKRGLPACAACHGPKGAGNDASQYPQVGGQNAGYTKNQLIAYKKGEQGERWDAKNKNAQMMSTIAANLTDAEIEALAAYLQGLQ